MLRATSDVLRITGDTGRTGVHLVSAVQSVGDTASLYNNSSAVAADLKIEVAANAFHIFTVPVKFDELFIDVGAAGPIYVHLA